MSTRWNVTSWAHWTLRITVVAVLGMFAVEGLVRGLVPPGLEDIPFDRSTRIVGVEDRREHPWAAGASTALTVAVVGDSLAMGVGNQKCSRLAFVLEWFLNITAAQPPAVVKLYAVPSSTYQQVHRVEQAIRDGASVVVLAMSLNDPEDWTKPLDLLARRPDLREGKLERWLQPLARHSRLVSLAVRAVERRRRVQGLRSYYEFLYRSDYSGIAKLRDALGRIQQLSSTHHVPVVAMLWPCLAGDLRPSRYPFAPFHTVVAQLCQEVGLPFLDLWPALAQSCTDRLELIPLVDGHGNEIVHRVAAEELFYFLLDRGLIPSDRRPAQVRELDRVAVWEKKLRALGQPWELSSSKVHERISGTPVPSR